MTATERGVVTTVLKYQVQNPSCTSWQNNDQMCGWPYLSKSVLASTLPSPGDSFMWFQPNLTKTFLGPRYSSPKSSLLSSPSLFETHLGTNNRNHHRLHIPISPFSAFRGCLDWCFWRFHTRWITWGWLRWFLLARCLRGKAKTVHVYWKGKMEMW